MFIYAYQNNVANVPRKSIKSAEYQIKHTPRNVDTNKLGTAVYLTVYGLLGLIDIIAAVEAFKAIAALMGA